MAYMDLNPYTRQPQTNTFATGNKRYGAGQMTAATSGALSSDGYADRERKKREKRRALQNRLMQQSGQYTDPTGGYIQ